MDKSKQKKKSNSLTITIIVVVIILGGWFLFRGDGAEREPIEIISRNGLHWHPQIHVMVHGEEVPIPANIGLVGMHNPIHTHDPDGIAHLEFSGVVADQNLRMEEFFRVWGKDFSDQCIFDNCNGKGGQLRMMVNGESNSEFHNYMMQDGDRIEIIYE